METVLFFLLTNFDPTFLAVFENYVHVLFMAELHKFLILKSTDNNKSFLDLDKKHSVARQKQKKSYSFIGNACVLDVGKNHPGKWLGCFYVTKTSVQLLATWDFKPYKHVVGAIQGQRLHSFLNFSLDIKSILFLFL